MSSLDHVVSSLGHVVSSLGHVVSSLGHVLTTISSTPLTSQLAIHLESFFPPLQDSLWTKRFFSRVLPNARFITDGDAGFGFLSIFLEVLFRRCRTIFNYSSYRTKVTAARCCTNSPTHKLPDASGTPSDSS